MCSPAHNLQRSRRRLENALLLPAIPPDELLILSRKLDRLVNHALRVRAGRFTRLPLRAVRPKIRNEFP